MDAKAIVLASLRLHPRVSYQDLADEARKKRLADELPELIPFGDKPYQALIAILDWDHRLPSKSLFLRLYLYTSTESLTRGEKAYEERVEEIRRRDKFPEFDVPDFDGLPGDEAYECEVTLGGEVSRVRLVSAWRRDVSDADAEKAVDVARRSDDFKRIRAQTSGRAPHLGDLEAVGWCPPCESDLSVWTLDVWYLTSFDGQIGRGKSLLVDVKAKAVLATRDFTVRAC